MADFKQIVKQAGDTLFANEIGKQEHVRTAWGNIEWLTVSDQLVNTDAELDRSGESPKIKLYPSLLTSSKAARSILREFGLYLLAKGGERAAAIWASKLITPSKEEVDLFDSKLKDKSLRNQCRTYEDVLSTYPAKGHSVERLVAVHLSNALLANNLPYTDSIGVDVRAWGPTAQFAEGKKYHSLIPLTSAYCPGETNRCFGCALASLLIDNLYGVLDISVAAALRIIIRNVIQRSI